MNAAPVLFNMNTRSKPLASWPDIVEPITEKTGARFMVSRRVVSALRQLPSPGFEAELADARRIRASNLYPGEPPDYFLLWLNREIEVDIHYATEAKRRQAEGTSTALADASYITLRPESYAGEAVVGLKTFSLKVYCSLAVLELAHRHRWTNFRFWPIDTLMRHVRAMDWWLGVDYVTSEWPPTQWYPSAPSSGRTMLEWFEYIQSSHALSSKARYALLDFGDEAIPQLIETLTDEKLTARARYHAADILRLFQQEFAITLPPGADDAMQKALAIGAPGPPDF
jgi:hypothetical protein